MNMIVPTAISATPNGTTRPQVRIVIVGHVDHGKSTLVGRLLHETGSLPEGKLEMLKAVSARRGMPFEWSFLLDALQTERDQGITIDTTQIRFRTRSRDVVLIDAPGHAEFLRNMITGASQADGAVLIIDALEGVRDQTRRHGYLLHLLGIRQVAVVVNKMDRDGADRVMAELRSMLTLDRVRTKGSWLPQVLGCVALSEQGVPHLLVAIRDHLTHLQTSGELEQRRRRIAKARLLAIVHDLLSEASARQDYSCDDLLEGLVTRKLAPYAGGRALLARLAQCPNGGTRDV